MANFVLLIAVLFATASFVSYTAAPATVRTGRATFATRCHSLVRARNKWFMLRRDLPEFWILLKFVSALRG